ncbi:hypothetical protein cypCar_00017581, partial [Cyprinus carpio]
VKKKRMVSSQAKYELIQEVAGAVTVWFYEALYGRPVLSGCEEDPLSLPRERGAGLEGILGPEQHPEPGMHSPQKRRFSPSAIEPGPLLALIWK